MTRLKDIIAKLIAPRVQLAALVCAVFATDSVLATEYSYDVDTRIETLEITEDSTLSGGHTLYVTNFTGSADATLTITGNSTLLPLKLPGWTTSLPSFQIESGSTLSMYLDFIHSAYKKGDLYLHSPVHGTGTLYLRTYEKDERVYVNSTNSTFRGTLSIYHRANQRTRNGIYFGRDGGPDGGYFPNRPLMSCAGSYTGNVYLGRYIATTPLTVRGLSGAQSIIQTADDSYSGNRFIDVELAANYSFSGTFVNNGDSAANPQPALLVSTKDGTAYTETLSGDNTTYGELIVTNGATVNLTGSWANGPVIVEDFSKLTTSAAKTFSSLTLKSEAVLTLANASSGITTTTTEVGEGNTVIINLTDASDIATAVSEGTALISWTTKPTGGNFVFASSELNQTYELVVGDSGLTIAERETPLVLTGVWTGLGKTTEWSNVLNWENNMIPGAGATATFPSSGAPWTVTLSDGAKTVGALVADGNVTFSGARIQVCDPDTETAAVSGEGTITLGNDAGFYAGSDANLELTLAANMKIIASPNHVAQIKGRTSGAGSGGATLKINGNLTGTGYLEVGGSRASINFNGDNSEFAGSVKVLDDASSLGGAHRTSVQFSPSASSANAAWNIVYNNNSTFLGEVKKTYYFGELTGEINNSFASSRAASTVELGARNTDFELIYKSIAHDGRQDTIVKRGTGTMTMLEGTSAIGTYNIAAGTLYVASRGGAPINALTFTGGKLRVRSYEITENEETTTYKADWSALIKNSTAPIAFDDDGVDYTWATALAASNTGGLTKSGTGTLTLSAAPLAETFEISVEAGKVVVPKSAATNITLAKGTKRTENGDNYEYEKGPDIVNGNTTNIEGLANQDAADAVAATYNVTLTDAQVTQGLETSYYKVIATSTATPGTYTISAVLNEEEVKVEFGDDEEEPVAFTDEKPTFKLKGGVKKGLYYSVGVVTSPDANPESFVAEEQATADGEEISLAVPSLSFGAGNVLYYKLSVSDTAQITP